MSRIDDILLRVRDTLADPNGDRWSDARLLRLLDEGQKQIVLMAGLLRTKVNIPVQAMVSDYSFPDDCYKVIRILSNGVNIQFASHEQMDLWSDKSAIRTVNEGSWEDTTGTTVEYIVFDKLDQGKFKLYPTPEVSDFGEWTLEAAPQSPDNPLYDPTYGIAINATGYTIEGDVNDDPPAGGNAAGLYGTVSDFSDDYTNRFVNSDDPDANGIYGTMTIFDDDSNDLTIYYLKRPDTVTSTSDVLEIDQVWDIILKYFISGMALRDDKDTQSRSLGNDELGMFSQGVQKAMTDAANDFTGTRTQYDSPYIGGFQ